MLGKLAASALAGLAILVSGCSTPSPIATVDDVDLQRFMGDWYVIANIPTFIEKGAHNAVETYRLADDGVIETRYCFRDGAFEGEPKCYDARGFVREQNSNAVWGMQFVWPFEAEYRIIYLAADYNHVVIGRSKRDHAWIMARQPAVPASDYAAMLAFLERQGYDTSVIEKVPQRW